DENYLLTNESATRIFKEIKDLPILDVHNHADAEEIVKNDNYSDVWQVMAATDHYVWEVERKCGVPEKFITGAASNKEKWMKLCEVFEDLVGNPCYEWIHLDFKERLGITDLICSENAESLWKKGNEVLAQDNKRPQQLLKEMNVESFCTTNNPIDMLEWHKKLAAEVGKGYMRPTWRPDKFSNISKPEWLDYIKKLSKRVNKEIKDIDDLVAALRTTHDYFAENGCIATDHGVEVPFGYKIDKQIANQVMQKRLKGDGLDELEIAAYMSYMLHEYGKMNAEKGWVMQIHLGAVRDVRDSLFEMIGPDSGGDVSDHTIEILDPLIDFLNAFDEHNGHVEEKYRGLKVVLYCLEPHHQATLATLSRAFGKNVTMGSAWWFNDTPIGMKRQLEYIMSVDVLTNFAGMVTDSRKIMSYGSRTEMFRRVLSDVLGGMVEKGQMPETLAIKAAKRVCYAGPKRFFGF
ncbi:MAG: glucuronate isomerase, partial [Candidatus Lokiarchaeota archaeon]|nr:glucuronate isomerase [Candidatus Lokiarchaeota archaeon]